MATNNGYADKNTSLITILSSEHGRLRREQRDIDKRDLQRALKYGTFENTLDGRCWKVEYDGIIFVTNPKMTREITAFPSPLPLADLDCKAIEDNLKVKYLLEHRPELSTSHTVIVIDNSGSMLSKKNDVLLYRDSQNAAFSFTALELIAEQLFRNTAVNSDLVSLVNFSEYPSTEFSREPVSWSVYNKILAHRNAQKYSDREYAPHRDDLMGGSNYLPTLEKVHQLLDLGYHSNLALSIYFFSDGRSTDHKKLGVSIEESFKRMEDSIAAMASKFGETLTVSMVGLGDVHDQFEPLKLMADAAVAFGSKGSFVRCEKTALSISSSISSMVTSTVQSRAALQDGGRTKYTERSNLLSEINSFPKYKWKYFKIKNHLQYCPRRRVLLHAPTLPLAAVHSDPEKALERQSTRPPYLAVNSNFFGMGAERAAFRCRLSDAENITGFVFQDMIAKETKYNERIEERSLFHKCFAETQDLASFLAIEFNKRLCGIPCYGPTITPRLCFLSCSVLLLDDPSWPIDGIRGVLVEKMLDTERFRWTKWNDNNGSVYGQKRVHNPIDVDFELKQLKKEEHQQIETIKKEEESDGDDSVSDVESESGYQAGEVHPRNSHVIRPDDYLRKCCPHMFAPTPLYSSSLILVRTEAFTHFTYRFTRKRVMVCDLQGVHNTDMIPPTFELTDPAVHYGSTKGRRMVFGRTDKGRSGMKAFFKTHKCTPICKMLHLSARNKEWSCDWRYESAQGTNFSHYS